MCRQKMDLTFLIRRLRHRGKNGFVALDEINRSVLLDFSNSVPIMFEKQWICFGNSFLLPGFAFLQPGLSRFWPGSRWIFWTMLSAQTSSYCSDLNPCWFCCFIHTGLSALETELSTKTGPRLLNSTPQKIDRQAYLKFSTRAIDVCSWIATTRFGRN